MKLYNIYYVAWHWSIGDWLYLQLTHVLVEYSGCSWNRDEGCDHHLPLFLFLPGADLRWFLFASWAGMHYGGFCVLGIAVGYETASLKSGFGSPVGGHPTVPGTTCHAGPFVPGLPFLLRGKKTQELAHSATLPFSVYISHELSESEGGLLYLGQPDQSRPWPWPCLCA